jgi:uncharacterized membrane protein
MEKTRITAQIAGHALHPLLRPFVIGYFVAVLGCDLLYAQASAFAQSTSDFAHITEWLLAAGLIMAVAAAIVALIDFFGDARFRALPNLWTCAFGALLVLALEGSNLDLRWTRGEEAIAPMGLILSLSAIAVLLATPSRAWARMYR